MRPAAAVLRVVHAIDLVALAVWLGGIVALGAVAAPIVFAVAPFPSNADAMTLVFRRFDRVAMTCAAIALAAQGARAAALPGIAPAAAARAVALLLAAAAAVFEGVHVAPRIAALHAAGAIRGLGAAGVELARLHGVAEGCGKAQVVLLVVALALSGGAGGSPSGPRRGIVL